MNPPYTEHFKPPQQAYAYPQQHQLPLSSPGLYSYSQIHSYFPNTLLDDNARSSVENLPDRGLVPVAIYTPEDYHMPDTDTCAGLPPCRSDEETQREIEEEHCREFPRSRPEVIAAQEHERALSQEWYHAANQTHVSSSSQTVAPSSNGDSAYYYFAQRRTAPAQGLEPAQVEDTSFQGRDILGIPLSYCSTAAQASYGGFVDGTATNPPNSYLYYDYEHCASYQVTQPALARSIPVEPSGYYGCHTGYQQEGYQHLQPLTVNTNVPLAIDTNSATVSSTYNGFYSPSTDQPPPDMPAEECYSPVNEPLDDSTPNTPPTIVQAIRDRNYIPPPSTPVDMLALPPRSPDVMDCKESVICTDKPLLIGTHMEERGRLVDKCDGSFAKHHREKEYMNALAPRGEFGTKRVRKKKGDPAPRTVRPRPVIACFFCRARKIACGATSVVGGTNPACNQCTSRGLVCLYPTENKRGSRGRKPKSAEIEETAATEAIASSSTRVTSNDVSSLLDEAGDTEDGVPEEYETRPLES